MRDSIRALTLITVLLVSAGCATGTHKVSVHGRPAEVTRSATTGSSRVEGELIALDEGRVWVLEDGGLAEVPRSEITRMKVRRHEMTGRRGRTWSLIGAIVTGGAMTIACASVSEGCGAVLPVMAVPWLAAGLLGGPSLDRSAHASFSGQRLEEARPYARFPQGLPPGFQGPPEPAPQPKR
jgi:hypothetical protein